MQVEWKFYLTMLFLTFRYVYQVWYYWNQVGSAWVPYTKQSNWRRWYELVRHKHINNKLIKQIIFCIQFSKNNVKGSSKEDWQQGCSVSLYQFFSFIHSLHKDKLHKCIHKQAHNINIIWAPRKKIDNRVVQSHYISFFHTFIAPLCYNAGILNHH